MSPQDAATRQLLERIRPAERPDEAYATAIEQILERRRERSDWPATMLHDLTVNTVYENGLSSTFKQVVFQVHDEEGARRWTNYSVNFEPGSQWVDLRRARIYRADGGVVESVRTWEQPLGNPQYRIYYDTRAIVVVRVPDLEPGDTVEIQLQRPTMSAASQPLRRLLRGPALPASASQPVVAPGLRAHHTRVAGLLLQRDRAASWASNTTVRSEGDHADPPLLGASDIPAMPLRTGQMPGMTEIAPYLHVSTYRTWEEVGRWWWGLIQDQLQMDDNLRGVGRRAGRRDAPDDAHEGAAHPQLGHSQYALRGPRVRHPRLQALPDPADRPARLRRLQGQGVPDVYVMFREAGIDARIVLVRTRRNGAITDLPASLAVFDHAIAYVPSLDLFLDGTAEMSGSTELPSGDQGVTVLLVGPDGAELRRTPVLPASSQLRERELTATLSEDGGARVEVNETVRGGSAASYRTRYQSEEEREEHLQRELSGTFPGIELTEQNFSDLDDFEEDVTYSYEATAPQFAQRTGEELRFGASTIGGLLRGLAPTETRQHPLDLGSRSAFVERRTVQLPRGSQVTHLPSGGEARSDFGHLTVRYEQASGQVSSVTELELERDRISAAEYPLFRQWVEQVDALLRERVTVGGGQ